MLDGMLVDRKTIFQAYHGQYPFIYLGEERRYMKRKCLAQEHNTLHQPRLKLCTARSGVHDKHINYKAITPIT